MFYTPFKHQLYRIVWLAVFVSNIGTWIHAVTASILIAHLNNSPVIIALVQTATMLPVFIFAIPAGVIADMADRSVLIFLSQLFMALTAFIMSLLSFSNMMTPFGLITSTFILNIGFAFNQPAWQAISSTLVPKEEIKQAAVLNNLSYNFSRCIGPAIAGYCYSLLGAKWLFFLNGFSFLGVIYIFKKQLPINIRFLPKLNKKVFFQNLKYGFYFFKHSILFRTTVAKSFIYFSLSASVWTLLPYLILVHNNMSNSDLGLMTTSAGLGAIANAYITYKMRQILNDSQLIILAFILSSIVIFIFGIEKNFYILMVFMFIFGISWSIAVSIFNGIIQSEFPIENRSRLIGIYYVFFSGAQVLGSYFSGLITHLYGLKFTTTIFAIIFLISVFIMTTKQNLYIKEKVL